MPRLQTMKKGKTWWIVGDDDAGPMGPYDNKQQAEEDRVGVARFHRHKDDPEFITGSAIIDREEE